MRQSVIGVLVAAVAAFFVPSAAASTLLSEPFTYPDKLITNGWAYTHTGGYESPVWEVSSGSLFAKNGQGWTGVPDACPTDIDSKPCTYSSVFRAYTDKTFSASDVTVSAVFTSQAWTSYAATPADRGIKLWNRLTLQGKAEYTAMIDNPDGRVFIKKKCSGGTSNGGTYYTLADDPTRGAWMIGTPHSAAFKAATLANGDVALTLSRDGATILAATDAGIGCAPYHSGHMGVRGDDAEFLFDDFVVSSG